MFATETQKNFQVLCFLLLFLLFVVHCLRQPHLAAPRAFLRRGRMLFIHSIKVTNMQRPAYESQGCSVWLIILRSNLVDF